MKKAGSVGNTLYVIADSSSDVQAWIVEGMEHKKVLIAFLGAPQLASQLAAIINEAYPEREEDDKP